MEEAFQAMSKLEKVLVPAKPQTKPTAVPVPPNRLGVAVVGHCDGDGHRCPVRGRYHGGGLAMEGMC